MITKKVIADNTMFPLLILGGAVQDFKKEYDGQIIRLNDATEVREFVSYYNSISKLDRVLVIEDLSFLPDSCEGLLLKFIEESKLNLVILSVFDKVSPIMLSRVKRVIKYSKEKVDSEFGKVSSGYKKLEETLKPDSHYFDKVRYMGKFSPKMYYLEQNITQTRIKNKIMSFVD